MIPYVLLLMAYAYFAMRVQCWRDISTLGFKLNTPQGYIKSPGRYHAIRSGLFFATAIAAIATGKPPIEKTLVVLVGVWGLCFWVGRTDAFDAFRKTHKELLAYEDSVLQRDRREYLEMLDGEDPSTRRAELEAAASMSNRELRSRLKRLRATGL